MDPRIVKLAQVLVDYSVKVQPGEWVIIVGQTAAEPALKAVYQRVLQRGGLPSLLPSFPWQAETRFKSANDQQLEYIAPIESLMFEQAKCVINILAETNTRHLSQIDPARLSLQARARRDLNETFTQRAATGDLRWVVTLFPTEAYAQDADMSLEDYEDFVYGAGLLDDPDPVARWREYGERQQQKVDWLKGHDRVHIRGANADLKLSIADRVFINACGDANFPDGEIFTGPVEDSAEGWVRFTYPLIVQGREVEGVEFTFEKGKVVKATARKNEDALTALLETDSGARYLGELGIGTSPNITRFTRSMLFDEKIKGTFHLAIGRSYPETGGRNISAIHIDLICDLHDGEMVVDGETFYRNGDFAL